MEAANRISAPSPDRVVTRMTAPRHRRATKLQVVEDTKHKTSTRAVVAMEAGMAVVARVNQAGIHLSRRDGIRDLNRKEAGNRGRHRSRVDGSRGRRSSREVGSRAHHHHSREVGSKDRRRRSRVGGSRGLLKGRHREGILGRGIRGKEGVIQGRDIAGVDIRRW